MTDDPIRQEEPIRVAVDLGASYIKAIAQGKSKPVPLSMSPYCAKTIEAVCNNTTHVHGSDLSLESSWVCANDSRLQPQYYLLGQSAKKYDSAVLEDGDRKWERAIYQVLGILGAYARKFGLKNQSHIRLAVLLPFAEYANSKEFKERIAETIEQFQFCGTVYGFNLDEVIVKPEGAGALIRGLPKEYSLEGLVRSTMLGYRNASQVVTLDGRPDLPSSRTCDLGYRWLVRNVMTATGNTDEERVLRWMLMKTLPTPESPEYMQYDNIAIVHQRRDELFLDYWQQLYGWWQKASPARYEVISGGTAWELQDEIKEKLPYLIWPDELHQEVQKYEPDPVMAFRYIDLYGVLLSMKKRAIG